MPTYSLGYTLLDTALPIEHVGTLTLQHRSRAKWLPFFEPLNRQGDISNLMGSSERNQKMAQRSLIASMPVIDWSADGANDLMPMEDMLKNNMYLMLRYVYASSSINFLVKDLVTLLFEQLSYMLWAVSNTRISAGLPFC